jgi:hypothetical protein
VDSMHPPAPRFLSFSVLNNRILPIPQVSHCRTITPLSTSSPSQLFI